MAIENLPVWPFEPNWTGAVGESLEWLTDVLQSPSGAEQRRSLRFFPRRTLDYTIAVEGEERTLLDNLLMTYSARDWYLPIWYDVTVSTAVESATYIPCKVGQGSRISVGAVVFIAGATPYDYQVAEVTALDSNGITVSPALTYLPIAGTQIYPMTIGRLREQPQLTVMTDNLATAEPQFLITERSTVPSTPASEAGLTDAYRDFYVLTREPDWTDRSERGLDRLIDQMETPTGIPEQKDTADRPFPKQTLHWVLEDFTDHTEFDGLLQRLRGRAIALWVPNWMNDMQLKSSTPESGFFLTVARCGYSMAGGPRPEREDIMIETVDGRRFYRRITEAVMSGTGNESIKIDTPIGEVIQPEDILRICFMSLMRLDHDLIEITHHTDRQGVAEVQTTFRAAPDLRVPEPAF